MKRQSFISLLCALFAATSCATAAHCAPQGKPAARAAASGQVYPQALCNGKVARWIGEQMPIRVYVSHGLCLDNFIDPSTKAPEMNTANTSHWPDLLIRVLQQPQVMSQLPIAEGYSEQQFQAAAQGIYTWKRLEQEGLFKYELTDNPDEADIYVFWTNHFVNKMGLALFENDIRGLTSKYMLPVGPVLAAIQRNDLEMVKRSLKPVVIVLRTSEQDGSQIAPVKMQAAAAHEFGHALGIDGHSTNPGDLMSVYYGHGVLSPNDVATARYLYRSAPQLMP